MNIRLKALHKTAAGFTLIELIMVIALVSIIAAVAAPYLLKGPSTVTVAALAKKVRDDIRYTQNLAMTRSNLDTPSAANPVFAYRIRFNSPDANCPYPAQYAIVNDADNNGVWGESPNASGVIESARNPVSGEDYFCVRLDAGDYAGFSVSADFGGSAPGVLEFDNAGIPYDSDRNVLAASKTVTVSKGGEASSVAVTPNTGAASFQ